MIELYHGDCLDVMVGMEATSIDTIITDPPYGLKFMGKDWDHGIPGVRFWREALRVAKSGAMLLAFGGTRTHHRLMVAIEDAGWEIRDCLMWLYGQGFPKSHNISKAIDKAAGAEREVVGKNRSAQFVERDYDYNGAARGSGYGNKQKWGFGCTITAPFTPDAQLWDGWGTALKPAWEPIILAMKPNDGTFANNAIAHGVAGIWVDGGGIGTEIISNPAGSLGVNGIYGQMQRNDSETVSQGRFPANLILDEEAAAMLDEQSGERSVGGTARLGKQHQAGHAFFGNCEPGYRTFLPNDTGGASRFFYCAKASRSERTCNGEVENRHPTVKPLSLMRYLTKLTKTPTGGTVLDMFAGSGTTPCACIFEERDCIAIEKERASFEIMKHRVECTQNEHRQMELI